MEGGLAAGNRREKVDPRFRKLCLYVCVRVISMRRTMESSNLNDKPIVRQSMSLDVHVATENNGTCGNRYPSISTEKCNVRQLMPLDIYVAIEKRIV